MAEIRINTKSSLTVCEGISGRKRTTASRNQLPSLYVRVYRISIPGSTLLLSSLTVCEGISAPAVQ